MNQDESNDNGFIELEELYPILLKQHGQSMHAIIDCKSDSLPGGTLGDVRLVQGHGILDDGSKRHFKLVKKTQEKWQRPGDPDSWRREYDLFTSDFGDVFSPKFRFPTCYHAHMDEDRTTIWMEYVKGLSGSQLSLEKLQLAAKELGLFQSRLHQNPKFLQSFSCFGDSGFLQREHGQWHSQIYSFSFLISDDCRIPEHVKTWIKDHYQDCHRSIEHQYLRSSSFEAPQHLKTMLIDLDDHKEVFFQKINELPTVLCHRDFWTENIIFQDDGIVLIDWDTAGIGYVGEDIASLIADETPTENLQLYFDSLLPSYMEGLRQQSSLPSIDPKIIWEMILIKFGYSIVQEHLFTSNQEGKQACIDRLEALHAIRF